MFVVRQQQVQFHRAGHEQNEPVVYPCLFRAFSKVYFQLWKDKTYPLRRQFSSFLLVLPLTFFVWRAADLRRGCFHGVNSNVGCRCRSCRNVAPRLHQVPSVAAFSLDAVFPPLLRTAAAAAKPAAKTNEMDLCKF